MWQPGALQMGHHSRSFHLPLVLRAWATGVAARATGAWFAHPEAVLLSLVCSSDREERELGVEKILERRGEEQYGDTRVRARRTPDINFSASSISDLISWDRDIHKPSFTCSLTKEQVEGLKDTPAPYFPLHSQSCERSVKQVRWIRGCFEEGGGDGSLNHSYTFRQLRLQQLWWDMSGGRATSSPGPPTERKLPSSSRREILSN